MTVASGLTPSDSKLSEKWKDAFLQALFESKISEPLKEAALAGILSPWTSLLTGAVIHSCRSLGWQAAAKGHQLQLLPQVGQEYLGIDVMAFPATSSERSKWIFPVAAFELENSVRSDRVAYSLWKVLCISASLRVVFAYRQSWPKANALVRDIGNEVMSGLTRAQRESLTGDTLIVMGSRAESQAFPWEYFKFWRLNALWKFEKL